MQSLAASLSCPHTACGPRSAAETFTTAKFIVPRSQIKSCRHQQRRQLRVEAAGSLVLSTLAAGAAAYFLSKQITAAEQEELQTTTRRPCPTCSGSGYEACHCTRWSDGDVGCSTCGRSGMMKCRSCGGGGTAVPIKVSIRKDY